MARETLSEKLARLQREKGTDIGLMLRPQLSKMPLPMQRYDDPFLPFGKAIIDATRDLICCVMFDLASYMSLGAASMVALERTIAYAKADTVTILHGAFATPDYAPIATEAAFDVDAVTTADEVIAEAYLTQPERGAFVHVTPRFYPTPRMGDFVNMGIWFDFPDKSQLILPDPLNTIMQRIQLLNDDAIYAGRGDDFADHTRTAVEAARNASKS
ncbi:MAG: hypothetical protein SGI73_10490 [Chloroflexota bacterium]|nr:hypothetical protein [Chloroflexota bacterium]